MIPVQNAKSAPQRRRNLGLACALVAAMLLPSAVSAAPKVTPLPYDAVLVIYFAGSDGKLEPHRFYDGDHPFQMSMCKARLDYLTKVFYRATRKDPSVKGKKAVRSACEYVNWSGE